jgi:hypothetical protein
VILVTPDRDSRVVVVVQEVVTQVHQQEPLVLALAAVVVVVRFTTLEGMVVSQPPSLTVGLVVMVVISRHKIMVAALGTQEAWEIVVLM